MPDSAQTLLDRGVNLLREHRPDATGRRCLTCNREYPCIGLNVGKAAVVIAAQAAYEKGE